MASYAHLKQRIRQRLDDDAGRLLELFHDDAVFKELVAAQSATDWYRFCPSSYDGEYLVRDGDAYVVYSQERGQITGRTAFAQLQDAARYFFEFNKLR